MGHVTKNARFLRGVAAGLFVLLLSGCFLFPGGIKTDDSRVDGKFAVPRSVNPPIGTPDELKPYISRFAQLLEFRGLKLEKTDNPRAFQLRLAYNASSDEVRVTADLLQDSTVVMDSTAYTEKPSKYPDRAKLIADLVNEAADNFDSQLAEFGAQVRITGQQQEAASAPEGSGILAFGTAFAAISPNTYVTARHVVSSASKIALYCGPNKIGEAEIMSVDTSNDLALLHSDLKADAYLEFAPNDSAAPGDHVFTMGFPTPDILGVEPKYTDGAISSLSGIADTKSIMQITVPIQPGNSGGPVVDSNGRVVGVVTASAAIPAFYNYTGTLPQNVNFAVSSYYVYPLIKDIQHVQDASLAKLTPVKRVMHSVCLVVVKETQSQ